MNRPDPDLDTEGETFDRRAGAVLIDLVLLAVVNGAILAPVALLGEAGATLSSALGTITTFAYFTALEAHTGQTLGKKALAIVVVTESGDAPDVVAVAVRNLLRFVDWLPAFYLLGAVVVSVTERDQRLGDLAAETVVVRVAEIDSEDGEEGDRDRNDDEANGNATETDDG